MKISYRLRIPRVHSYNTVYVVNFTKNDKIRDMQIQRRLRSNVGQLRRRRYMDEFIPIDASTVDVVERRIKFNC